MSGTVGWLNVALGIVYCSYGLMTARELALGWRTQGPSHFGLAWLAMAFTCGPHHLEHGVHLLAGRTGGWLEAVALLAGIPAGATWFALRVEAMLGGRGDRVMPSWLARLALAGAVAYAAALPFLLVAGTSGPLTPHPRYTVNISLVVLYVLVGVYLLRTQLRSHRASGTWSLSGVALSAVFPTCAVMHLSFALAASSGQFSPDAHVMVTDWAAVPAAAYFVWVVRALHHGTLPDWRPTARTRARAA